MQVRIRFGKGPRVERKGRKNRRAALAMAALLAPAAAMAAALGAWRLAADLNWAEDFAISRGLFSHWQVWFASALLLQLCSRTLNRYGKGGDKSAGAVKTSAPAVAARQQVYGKPTSVR